MSKKTVIEQMIGLLRTPITQRKGVNIPPDECLIWDDEALQLYELTVGDLYDFVKGKL